MTHPRTLIDFGLTYERALEIAWSLSNGLRPDMVEIEHDSQSNAHANWAVYIKSNKPIVIVSGGLVQEIHNVPESGILVLDFDDESAAPKYVSVGEYTREVK